MYYKPCSKWSDRTKTGGQIRWTGLHPKARDFLFTEGTFNELSMDHEAYARVLIEGGDLSPWHQRSDWIVKAERAKRGAVSVFDARRIAIARMADNAWQACSQSGAVSLSVKKDKSFEFRRKLDLEEYAGELLAAQDGLCALTGLPMEFGDGDPEMHCSLDRIDSDKDYEKGNLQVVCWFANRWKAASANEKFLSLIHRVREATS